MKKYITLILLSIPFSLVALDAVNVHLLNHAKQYSKSELVLEDIVHYLIQPAGNESEKAEVLFYWIAHNIDYDTEGYVSKSYLTNKDNILKRKKGVCQDYAELYKSMCNLAKIECYVISGYAKGYGYSKENIFPNTNHAWNVVKVDGEFKLVDTTWGSGSVMSTSGKLTYIRELDLENILVKPGKFSERHLPADPRWQLLAKPISMKRFVTHEDFDDMCVNIPIEYDFIDSIKTYKALDRNDQHIAKYLSRYKFHPTQKNLIQLIVSCRRAARELSHSDYYNERNLRKSIYLYSKAENLCAKINDREELLSQVKKVHSGIKYSRYRLMKKE